MGIKSCKYSLFIVLALSSCGDNTEVVQGTQGTQGISGSAGLSSLVKLTRSENVDETLCASKSGVLIQSGLDENSSGKLDIEEITSAVLLCDGAAGSQGEKGDKGDPGTSAPQYQVTEIIDPCGDTPGIYDEVLLRMANGSVIASFSDNASGLNTRFSIIPPGTYIDTDGSNCVFTVHADGAVTW